ncbi:sulfotransferase [Paraglaciecola sp. 2405UD69-4]|uniref:sulfotransferase n=1 Tax=Paraglaciecola sp. 2405UD69-4 TaxID=3391836 RepID=UPI0039C9F25D
MKNKSNNKIIYIAGFPRSGTTWFANLLNSHSQTIYRHELIGRNKQIFGQSLYKSMKFNNGVTDDQHSTIMSLIQRAEVETDKPPFFVKSKGFLKFPFFHQLSWLCTKSAPKILAPSYNSLYRVSDKDDYKILMKETGEAKFIESFRNSLRSYVTLFLVRNPLGSISSHIKGINKGSMPAKTTAEKRDWLNERIQNNPEQASELKKLNPDNMSDAIFFGLQWRNYHEKVAEYCNKYNDYKIYFYDELVSDTPPKVNQILEDVGLKWEKQVGQFIAESSGEGKSLNRFKKFDSNDKFYSVYRDTTFKKNDWHDVITPEDVEFITNYTKSTLEKMQQLSQANKD